MDNNSFYKKLLESASDGVFIMDIQGRLIDYSHSVSELLGYSHEEMQSLTVYDWDKQITEDEFSLMASSLSDKATKFERVHTRKDGTEYIAEITSVISEFAGQRYIYAAVRDISDEKNIRTALEQSRNKLKNLNNTLQERVDHEVKKAKTLDQRYKQLFNIVHEGLCVHSFENHTPTNFIEVNERMCDIFGYTREELLNLSPVALHTDESFKKMSEHASAIFEFGYIEFEAELVTKSGVKIDCMLNLSLQQFDNRTVVFTSIKDISETKRLQKDNDQKQQLLIQQSKLADMGSMIAAIAHQWKQPLNVIALTSSMMELENEENEEISEMVACINEQVAYMSETIDDFRSFFLPTKEKVYFSVRKAVEQVMRILSPRMKTQSIDLSIDGNDNIMAYGFRNEFMQVVMNIVNNARDAIKSRIEDGGMINISIDCIQDITIVKIADNGGGVPSDLLPEKIFEPYFTTKGADGAGIGLSMARTIIEKYMEGSLTVSNSDAGAVFVITLHAVEEKIPALSAAKEKSILYVEDDEFVLGRIGDLLAKEFGHVFRAKNGAEGLEIFSQNSNEISIILSDIDMPVMNGLTMSKKIRAIDNNIPIVVLTVLKEDVIENIGFDAIIEKPVNMKKLMGTLKGLL